MNLMPPCPVRCGADSAPGLVLCQRCWRFVAPGRRRILGRIRREWIRGQATDEEYDAAIAATVRSMLYGKQFPARRGIRSTRPPKRVYR